MQGILIAESFIKNGIVENAVVVGSESFSNIYYPLLLKNRNNYLVKDLMSSLIFGDGAASVVISKNKIGNINIYDFELNINKVFEKNDYLVSASKKEAQSLVIIQSLASGKPIIGISNETIDELINNTNGLAVKKGISPKNFARQIIKFTKENNYFALSKKCVEDSKKFDINLVVSKIEDCYQRLSNTGR
jgi:glycosyltransferase involved in cell wall biosynthesis